jgi:class 3 adenylate cyclase
MAIQPTFLLIADIAGYTRFMKLHRWSLVHAQDIVAQLLEAVIDATRVCRGRGLSSCQFS